MVQIKSIGRVLLGFAITLLMVVIGAIVGFAQGAESPPTLSAESQHYLIAGLIGIVAFVLGFAIAVFANKRSRHIKMYGKGKQDEHLGLERYEPKPYEPYEPFDQYRFGSNWHNPPNLIQSEYGS